MVDDGRSGIYAGGSQMIPSVYAVVSGSKIRTKSTEPRLDGAVFDLTSEDASDVDIRGDVACLLRISPFRPARIVLLRVIRGGLTDAAPTGPHAA